MIICLSYFHTCAGKKSIALFFSVVIHILYDLPEYLSSLVTYSTDHEILQAIREGNEIVFRGVFDANYEQLCHYASTIVRDSDEAEDIVQSMFVKLWEQRASLDIKFSVRAYLFKAVRHRCLNHLDHKVIQKKHSDFTLTFSEGSQPPDAFSDELEENVKKAIDSLPPQCKTIFLMSRYEALRHDEIAQRLNISVNTIQNQICKALKILRDELKDMTT